MAKLLSAAELKSLSDGPHPIAFFGAGAIAEKTAEKYCVNPQFIVDNSKDSQGTIVLGNTVQSPQELFGPDNLIPAIICSTSIDQIEKQLLSLGVAEGNIYISPKLSEFKIISDFEAYQFDILFTSGLQDVSPDGVVSGGGLYRVEGSFDDFSVSKISSGSCHIDLGSIL